MNTVAGKKILQNSGSGPHSLLHTEQGVFGYTMTLFEHTKLKRRPPSDH